MSADAERGREAALGPTCGSAYQHLCGDGGARADARSERHKQILVDVQRETFARLATALDFAPADRDGWARYLETQPAGRREELTRFFRKTRAAIAAQRAAETDSEVRTLFERLHRAALEVAREARELDAAALRRLRRARIVPIDLGHDGELPRATRLGCGEHLMIDDAWVSKDALAITLCPGLVLVSSSTGELEASLAFLVAHELGHVIAGPSEGEHGARRSEIVADAWGARILAADLARRAGGDGEAFLRRTLEPICSPEHDAVHPPGPERVAAILAREPQLASALSCEPGGAARPSGR